MKKNSRLISSLILIWLAGIIFLVTRLVNLRLLPIFADEAIYLRWAQVMKAEPSLRFLPLSDGKQPLYMWIVMFLLGFKADPLLTGRLVSVAAGFGSWLGVMFFSWLVTKKVKTAAIAGWLFAILPYFVFYDRLALADSLLAMLAIWFYSLTIIFARHPSLAGGLVAGISLGLGLITKSPAMFFAIVWPAVLLMVGKKYYRGEWSFKKVNLKWGKVIRFGLWAVVIWLVGLGIYNLLRLGPEFGMIASRNKDYVFSFQEVLSHPTDPLRPHLNDLADWFPNLLTWPVVLAWFYGTYLWLKDKKWGRFLYLAALSFGPILAQASIAKVFTPRYLLYAVWPLIVVAAVGLSKLASRNRFWLVIILVTILPFLYTSKLLTDPARAPLPRKMRSGYLEEWTAGQGIVESAVFLKGRLAATDQTLLVGTEGYFGTLPDGLLLYFDKEPRVTIIGVGQPLRELPSSLTDGLVDNEVYLVANRSRFLFENERLKEVGVWPKEADPEGFRDELVLFQVKPDEE